MTPTPLLDWYPNQPGFKERGGPSQEAAEKVKDKAATLRQEVHDCLRIAECTADECAAILERDILSIRPRFSELRAQGLIEKATDEDGKPRRRKSSRGASQAVWRAV